jgi:hypothetical protein
MKAPFNRLHAYQLTARVTAIDAAPRGAKPGVVKADTVPVTARVAAIDRQNYQATLKFPTAAPGQWLFAATWTTASVRWVRKCSSASPK